ncbi:MAG: SpoIID/LytB domain-containing protein [Bacillota bacterium]|nr:SpoIID/LytB domain-containing protein [Bacillota bacterium]
MKKEKDSGVLLAMLFFMLPYLLTVIISGRKACPISRQPDLEEYIPILAAAHIDWGYEKAAIQAQTVIERTNLSLKNESEEAMKDIQEAADYLKKKNMNGEELKQFQRFQEAADDTKEMVLVFQNEKKELPYHALSQGKTRSGEEILGEKFAYIPSVETPKDIDSPLYIEGCYFSLQELEEKIKKSYPAFSITAETEIEITKTDSAGYVMEIQIGNQVFQGERIKELLDLPSSCFSVQSSHGEVRFLCKGIGHGMGMSQYTAHHLALEGKNYEQILAYFFPDMEIQKEK